jgi:hypothetical protein
MDPQSQKSASFGGLSHVELEALRLENLGVWCALNTFKVDHRSFTFAKRKYLKKIYLSTNPLISVRKCTQVGLTIWMVLKVLHKLRYAELIGAKIAKKAGFYFPVHDAVSKFSKDRLAPLVANIPEFSEVMDNQGSIELKQLGNSSLYMSYMGGTATKDSTPLDIICLDETRLMDVADINQVEERLSGSLTPEIYKISTAGLPNDAIDKAFLQGNQQFWHTVCNCSDGVILSDVFPDCIGQRRKKGGVVEYFYRCPVCGKEDLEPQDGDYRAHNPSSHIDSFHIHHMLSPTKTPKIVWERYITTDNIKEFYNAVLGKPYIDEENIGLTDDELVACVNTDLTWGMDKQNTCMGVDQRSGQLHVVILKPSSGKKQIVHVEVVDNYCERYKEGGKIVSPFKRLYQLMHEYDVDMCVLDALPNANEAKEFAAEFPGRIFLSYYKGSQDMARWSDKNPKTKNSDPPPLRKSKDSLKFKWVVLLDRYKSIEYALRHWRDRSVECPPPRGLVQEVRDEKTGTYQPEFVCENILFTHMKSVVRELVQSKLEPGRYRYRWNNLGLDPHFLHAFTYAVIASERKKRAFNFAFI